MSELQNSLPEPQVRSKIYKACVDMYTTMRNEAVWDTELQADVWTGSTIKLIETLGYYPRKASESRAHLERMGCVQFLQIGRSRKPSIIMLVTPPTPELWIGTKPTLRDAYRPAELVELALLNRVDKLEQEMQAVLQFLAAQFPTVVRRVHVEKPHDVGRSEEVPEVSGTDGRGEHAALDTGLDEQSYDRGMSDGDLPVGQDSRTENDSDSQ